MQFTLDFQVAEVVDGRTIDSNSVVTSVQLQEYGMYTLNFTDASTPVGTSALEYENRCS